MPITATKTNSKTGKTKSFKTKKTKSFNKTSWKSTRTSSPTTWFNQFNTNFVSSAKSWGWTPSQISACSKAFSACFTSWNTFSTTGGSNGYGTHTTTTTKKKTKKTTSTNGKKATTKRSSTSIPSTAPNFSFDWTKKGRCTIHFGTNPSSTKTNKFPTGTKCVCLQFRVGSSNWKTIATTTKTWFTQIVSNPIPKTLQYRACYVNRNGTKGAWHTVSPNFNKAAA
jgi:hypothetical protein